MSLPHTMRKNCQHQRGAGELSKKPGATAVDVQSGNLVCTTDQHGTIRCRHDGAVIGTVAAAQPLATAIDQHVARWHT